MEVYEVEKAYVNIERLRNYEPDLRAFIESVKQPNEKIVDRALLWTCTDHNQEMRLSYLVKDVDDIWNKKYYSSLAVQEQKSWVPVIRANEGTRLTNVKIDADTFEMVIAAYSNQIYTDEDIIAKLGSEPWRRLQFYAANGYYCPFQETVASMVELVRAQNFSKEQVLQAIAWMRIQKYDRAYIHIMKRVLDRCYPGKKGAKKTLDKA